MVVVALPFKIQNRVGDVLKRLGPRNASVLGHVPNQKHGDVFRLGQGQKLGSNMAHLADAPRSRIERFGKRCLHRIDDHVRRTHLGNRRQYRLEAGFRQEVNLTGIFRAEALGAHLDLLG